MKLTHPFTLSKLRQSTRSTTILLFMASQDLCRSAIQNISIHNPVSFLYNTDCSYTKKNVTVNFFDALNYLGVPTEFDQAEGSTAGAAFVPTDLDPNNQTRSDARVAYYDPYSTRENFHVITGQHVTQLIIEGVAGDPATGNPTSGGNTDGEGTASGNTGGLNFGPEIAPAPVAVPGTKFVRQASSPSSLRITGVQVRFTQPSNLSKLTYHSLLLMLLRRVKQSMLHER